MSTEQRAAPARQHPGRSGAPERRPRPDPNPVRIAFTMAGVATTSALLTGFLIQTAGPTSTASTTLGADPSRNDATGGEVQRVIRYVQLAPGQTAPPNSVVRLAPGSNKPKAAVRTRQSGD